MSMDGTYFGLLGALEGLHKTTSLSHDGYPRGSQDPKGFKDPNTLLLMVCGP